MSCGELQRREIETIKERTIILRLSDADVHLISKKAAVVGLSVSQLLENFIGDLVDGTYSNGSDERNFANQWLERCGFEMLAEKSLLRYAVIYGLLDTLLESWNERANLLEELSSLGEHSEDTPHDEMNSLKDELDYCNKNIEELFTEYRQYNPQCTSIEDEMKAILQWQDECNKLLYN